MFIIFGSAEDDGFLLVYIYKAAEDTSYFVVSSWGVSKASDCYGV